MKIIRSGFQLTLYAWMAVTALPGHTAAIQLCSEDEEVFPWTLKDGSGLNTILLKMAADKSGVAFEETRMSWRQCLDAVKTGAKDGAVGASYNAERSKFAAYPTDISGVDLSRRIMTDDYVLYRLKGSQISWDGRKFTDLNGPVGIQTGYSIGNDIRKLGVEIDDASKNSDELVKRLLKGELRAISMLANEARYLLRQPEIADKVERVARPLVQKPYYVIFNKIFYDARTKEAEAFWDAIGVSRESSRYKATERVMLEQ
jgi:polar amino acid transport system substrate-binding protein